MRDQGAGGLGRHLGLFDAAAILVGIVLGSGIFVAPQPVAAAAPGVAGLWLWLVGGLIAACGAFCYAECGARLPRTGGFYVFYRRAFGEPLAFVGGWAAVLVTYPASIAAIALIFGAYLREAAPALGARPVAAAAAALVAVGVLNAVGVRAGAWTQRILTSVKVAALGLLCLAAIVAATAAGAPPSAPPAAAALPAAAAPSGMVALLGALVVVLWTYDGWSDVTLVTGEIREPGRNLGRAVLVGIVLLVALYGLTQLAVVAALPAGRAAASPRVLSEAVQAGLGGRWGRAVAWLVVISTFGSMHGVTLTVSRLAYAMAEDGVFPRAFGAIHPVLGTPARAVAAVTAASIVYVLVAGFGELLAYFSFSVWIFYGLTAVALLRLRRGGVGEPAAWGAPGGRIAPAVVLATAAAMTVSLFWQSPGRSSAGLAMLAAGFGVYYVWRRWRS